MDSIVDQFIDWVLEHPDENDPGKNRLDILVDYMNILNDACKKLNIEVENNDVQRDLTVWSTLLEHYKAGE
jgi:hypothetical protein